MERANCKVTHGFLMVGWCLYSNVVEGSTILCYSKTKGSQSSQYWLLITNDISIRMQSYFIVIKGSVHHNTNILNVYNLITELWSTWSKTERTTRRNRQARMNKVNLVILTLTPYSYSLFVSWQKGRQEISEHSQDLKTFSTKPDLNDSLRFFQMHTKHIPQ